MDTDTHRNYVFACARHRRSADGELTPTGKLCQVCGWDGWVTFTVGQGHKVKGYNGRSVAARRRDVKPNAHKSGRLDPGLARGELRLALHGGSAAMARDAGTVAVNRLMRQAASVSSQLAELGY